MNAPASPSSPVEVPAAKPRKGLFWALVILLLIVIALPIYAVTSVLRMGAESIGVRDAIVPIASVSGRCDKRIELNLGTGLLGIARLVTTFADVPVEARIALGSVRRLQVGVYYLPDAGSGVSGGKVSILERATAVLDEHDWERVVGVVDGTDVVGVFVPRVFDDAEDMDVCVVVLSDHDLIVVSVRANVNALAPLIERAMREI